MSNDHPNIPQEPHQSFNSDIWLPDFGNSRIGDFSFPPLDNHDINDNDFHGQQHAGMPLCPPYPQHNTRYSGAQVVEDDVFTNSGQPSLNQVPASHQQYVSYSTCTIEQQYQQNNQPTQGNIQVPEQNNYDGYMHSASPDTASISSSPYTPAIRQEFSVSPTGNQPLPSNKINPIPSVSDYAGENGFEMHFANQTESAVKSAQYTYSKILAKLFVKRTALCPIQFKCLKQPPHGSYIRALPVYVKPEDVTDVVTRCPNHHLQDSTSDQFARYLVRAEQPGNNTVQYQTTSDGRESVIINYLAPQVGSEYITIHYSYMCLSSCVGGINRRPIMTIFTLESPDGHILGRRCVEVRVCCCPGRDRAQEERRKKKPPGGSSMPKKKKLCAVTMPSTSTAEPEGDRQEFLLRVKGKEKYEMLKKIKEALDMLELVSKEEREQYERREATAQEAAMKKILSNYFKKGDGDDSGPFPT